MSKEYNGWSNYETWAVNLWMGNDSGSYDWATEQAKEHWDEARADEILTRSEKARYALADYFKDYFEDEELCPLLGEATMYTDLLRAALSEVNWNEIADAWLNCDDIKDDGYEPIGFMRPEASI